MSRLTQRLDRIRSNFSEQAPAAALAVMHDAVEEVRASGILDGLPQVGDKLPAFALPDTEDAVVRLPDLLARGPLVVTFYRGFW